MACVGFSIPLSFGLLGIALCHTQKGSWLQLRILKRKVFVSNRGDTYYSITAGSRQRSLAKPLSLLFLAPRPPLSSHQHRTLVCLFWSGNLHCSALCSLNSKSHNCSPRVLWAAGCILQLNFLFLQHLAILSSPEWPYCQRVQCGRCLKQSSRPKVILKTQPPICLDYRPQLTKKPYWQLL